MAATTLQVPIKGNGGAKPPTLPKAAPATKEAKAVETPKPPVDEKILLATATNMTISAVGEKVIIEIANGNLDMEVSKTGKSMLRAKYNERIPGTNLKLNMNLYTPIAQ